MCMLSTNIHTLRARTGVADNTRKSGSMTGISVANESCIAVRFERVGWCSPPVMGLSIQWSKG